MKEYIINTEDLSPHQRYEYAKELIIRCRDCVYYSKELWERSNGEVIDTNCFLFKDCEGTPATVEPNGFCAWGERKE